MNKIALITGITGQDGSYLSELLLEKGYIVHGIIRRSSSFNISRIEHIYNDKQYSNRFFLHYGDLSDSICLVKILSSVLPNEIYNLGAQSHVKISFDIPEYTCDVDALGTLRLLEAMRITNLTKSCRFYNAASSEMFGDVKETPQTEKTPFSPRSPYACAKVFAYWITVNYREAYGIHASNGILFNHESPRRGATFVTRKITRAVVRISAGIQECLILGNLDARRDWGFSKEYVEAMWKMLQQDTPDDYVVGTGKTYSVKYFVEKAFAQKNIEIIWKGNGMDEIGIDNSSGKIVVKVDPRYFRPSEVNLLLSNPSKAELILNWKSTTTLDELIKKMLDADTREFEKEG